MPSLSMLEGMDAFARDIERKKEIYNELVSESQADTTPDAVFRVPKGQLFEKILQYFGVSLDGKRAVHDLSTIYEIGLHKRTGALVIANKGATLFCLAPRTEAPYIARHIGFCIYFPGLGIEMVNVALVGNVYAGPVILRTESACTPSFLFGSQRCNCAHQWETTRELAGFLNPITPSTSDDGREFEKWVQSRFTHIGHQHLPADDGPGLIMMHLDTQNGMGSGYTSDSFSFDLFSRASLRHRGEYTAEQVHDTTMAGGFKAIGVTPDPRGEDDEIGYKITPLILDWLGTNKTLILLSNNRSKINQLRNFGYTVERIKSIGRVNTAGAQEALERGVEFDHMDIGPSEVTYDQEMQRLKVEIGGRVRPLP